MKWLVGLLYVLVAVLFVLVLSGCVPLALYNYATHDVAGEAEQSDCYRDPQYCKVKPACSTNFKTCKDENDYLDSVVKSMRKVE